MLIFHLLLTLCVKNSRGGITRSCVARAHIISCAIVQLSRACAMRARIPAPVKTFRNTNMSYVLFEMYSVKFILLSLKIRFDLKCFLKLYQNLSMFKRLNNSVFR